MGLFFIAIVWYGWPVIQHFLVTLLFSFEFLIAVDKTPTPTKAPVKNQSRQERPLTEKPIYYIKSVFCMYFV